MPDIRSLPDDVLRSVFARVGHDQTCAAWVWALRCTCRRWRALLNAPDGWRDIVFAQRGAFGRILDGVCTKSVTWVIDDPTTFMFPRNVMKQRDDMSYLIDCGYVDTCRIDGGDIICTKGATVTAIHLPLDFPFGTTVVVRLDDSGNAQAWESVQMCARRMILSVFFSAFVFEDTSACWSPVPARYAHTASKVKTLSEALRRPNTPRERALDAQNTWPTKRDDERQAVGEHVSRCLHVF